MAQKTILSFFKSFGPDSSKELKRAPSKVSESVVKDSFETKCIIEDSPIKRKKRKIKCIESDDEPDTIKVLTSSSKIDEQEEMKDCQSTKRKSKENIQKELHGETSSKKSPKVKKIKNGENEKSSELPIKMETNGKDDCKDELSEIDNILLNSQSTSTGMDSSLVSKDVEVIPKRKTARKQFNSVKKVETNIIKDGNNSKFGIEEQNNNEITTKCSLLNDELNSNEKDFKNDNEMVLSNHSQLLHSNTNLSENEKSPKIQESSKNVLSDFTKEESSSKTDTESLSNAKTKGTLKKSAKKVSIQSKRSNPSTKETENELSGSENNFNSEINCDTEILDDSKKPSNVKHKSRNKSTKEILLKKENSIHSFFAPLKKMKDKTIDEKHSIENEIDNNEKDVNKNHQKENVNTTLEDNQNASVDQEKVDIEREMENIPLEIDSPVKELSKSRKVHSLDSEDEKLEAAKMAVNIKSEKIKNYSLTSLEELKTTSKNNEDIFESSKKTEILLDSKTHKENQKLSIKSTSSDTVYDPSKIQYHPIKDAFWKQNEKTPYLALAKTLELIENTSGRLKIIEILSNFFRSVIVLSPDDFLQSVYLCLNRLAPEYEGIELGVGETLLMKVVAQATGRTLQQIKSEVAVKGDLGLVSESSRGNQRVMFAPPKLSVSLVFNKFLEIAKMSGNAAMVKKIDKIQSLFVACRDCEAKYIIRSLSGKLRIGLAEQSVLTAIARAVVLTPPGQSYPPEIIDASKKKSEKSFKEILDSETMILKTVYCECPNYDLIIPVLLKEGISALPKCCQLSPGRPLKPMLAHPTAGIDIILQRFDKNPFTCEFKYDGERAQIHMTEDGEVKIFSRNQEDNTSKYPDVISRISKALESTTKSFILDSEAVAWDKETKQILPFQVLSTRKKKDAVESEIKVQVCIMAFDLLYLNGKSLVKEPLKERRSLLHSAFREVEDEFMFAQYRDGNSPEAMQEFLDESVKGNCEGLMVKALEIDASYEIAKRSHNWLKLKKDYLQGIGDTLDLVVIGGYYGKGKRAGNYGGFLLACYDEDSEEFQSICKLGTGFKDDVLEAHTAFLKQHMLDIPKPYYRFDHTLEPDVWFKPVQVWEIKCADMSISPVHKAAIGIVDPEKGISLRFPRFIRTRDDKTAENATSSVQIANMYQKQEQIQNTSNKNAKVEEDFY